MTEEYVITNRYEEDQDMICISPHNRKSGVTTIGLAIVISEKMNKKDKEYKIIGELVNKTDIQTRDEVCK